MLFRVDRNAVEVCEIFEIRIAHGLLAFAVLCSFCGHS